MSATENHYFDITIFPDPEPEPQPKQKVKPIKYKFPWRIVMLAKPNRPRTKYQPPPPITFKTFGPVDRATAFRADHLARPMIRFLTDTRRAMKWKGPKYDKRMSKFISKSWDSIYNYYNKKLRDREMIRYLRKLHKAEALKPKGKALEALEKKKQEHLALIATPKKVHLPEKIPRKWKALEDLMRDIDKLASPVERKQIPPKQFWIVNPHALTYEPTEIVQRLYTIPERFKRRFSEPCMGIKKSALRYKCTPRVEKLAQPSFSAREAKKHDEDKYDPWIIPKNALTYKPTARILELAKPLERE